MPRTLPAGMIAELQKTRGFFPVVLADIQAGDGTNYFLTDFEGSYPSVVAPSPSQYYSPWVKSAGPFKLTRDLTTGAADLVLQNLGGNSISREVSSALQNHEWEGALAILRLWLPPLGDVMDQWNCYLTEQTSTPDEVSFRALQIFDPSQYNVATRVIGPMCNWDYKSLACGSAGTATACSHLFSDCKDPSRAAVERFDGVLSLVPNAAINPVPVNMGGGATGGNGGPGSRRPILFR